MTATVTTATVTTDVPRVQPEPPKETDPGRRYDAWRCGLSADAGPEEHRHCEDVLPELIVELL